ncbi:MAG: glycerophosphodiester phosphodiesterase [Deinococcales bacterium]
MLRGPFATVPDALAFVVALAAALALWRAGWRGRPLPGVRGPKKPLLVGHRGTRGVEPENTLRAFRRAFDDGLDGIEFDVQRTLDGVLVLLHDEVVGGRPVTGQSLARPMPR